jgi:signal transduction histidine kinase
VTVVAPERLAGVLGHELRNPVASALTGAMAARELLDDDDPRAALVDGVVRDLQRVAALTDGWLAQARGLAGPRRALDLGELLTQVASRHDAELAVVAGVRVDGDADRLARMFDNLCENARRSGARRVRIGLRVDDGACAVAVEDDGCGLAAADVERLFEPGWSATGGAGLGLHVVAATAAAHGGDVVCTPLPRGARFTVRLPIVAAGAATA